MNQKSTSAPIAENKMGTMPVGRLVLNMSLPMMISMLVQALYNIVDSVFVAMLSENALTAVSMAFPLQTLLIAVGAVSYTHLDVYKRQVESIPTSSRQRM